MGCVTMNKDDWEDWKKKALTPTEVGDLLLRAFRSLDDAKLLEGCCNDSLLGLDGKEIMKQLLDLLFDLSTARGLICESVKFEGFGSGRKGIGERVQAGWDSDWLDQLFHRLDV